MEIIEKQETADLKYDSDARGYSTSALISIMQKYIAMAADCRMDQVGIDAERVACCSARVAERELRRRDRAIGIAADLRHGIDRQANGLRYSIDHEKISTLLAKGETVQALAIAHKKYPLTQEWILMQLASRA